jgi:cytoskeletal protein RodZ
MKRTYAAHEEQRGLAAGQDREPLQEAFGPEPQLPERIPGALLGQLPAAPAARTLRQTAVRQMQQTRGNTHVQRELLPQVSRQEDDELRTPVEAQAPAPATQAPTAETETAAPATQAPMTTTEAPAPEVQAPTTEAEEPTAGTEAPALEAQVPTAETEMPAPEAEVPTTETEAPTGEAGQAPTTISGDGSTVSADAGGVTIDGARLSVNAATVNINSAMVTTSGVLRTNTLMADNVVASAYTPGVGNVQ